MKCSEIMNRLTEMMPLELQEEWDNSGFQAGRLSKNVKSICVCLDLTSEAADAAIAGNADLIVTHHPLIFHPLKQISEERILKILENGISVISMHTNYDRAKGCMADLAAERMQLKSRKPFTDGFGKTGKLPRKMTVDQIADAVKKAFDLPYVQVFNGDKITAKEDKIIIMPGGGHSMVRDFIASECKIMISSDFSHDNYMDTRECGKCLIDAGHYGIEKIFIDDMCRKLQGICGSKVKVSPVYEVNNGPGYYR